MKVELLQKSTGMVMTASSSRKSRSGCALALLDGPANSAPFEREHTVFLSSFLISNRVLFDLGSRFPFMLAPRYPLRPRKLPVVYSWTENFLPSSSGQRTRRSRSGRSSWSGAAELLLVGRRLMADYWVQGFYIFFCISSLLLLLLSGPDEKVGLISLDGRWIDFRSFWSSSISSAITISDRCRPLLSCPWVLAGCIQSIHPIQSSRTLTTTTTTTVHRSSLSYWKLLCPTSASFQLG